MSTTHCDLAGRAAGRAGTGFTICDAVKMGDAAAIILALTVMVLVE